MSSDDDQIEKVAMAIQDAAIIDVRGDRLTDSEIAVAPVITNPEDIARAAICAINQRRALDDLLRMDGELYDVPERAAPRLSEEERARVEEAAKRNEYWLGRAFVPAAGVEAIIDRAFLLSLIDKLTNQEPCND